jgi:hypothetical protein
VSLLAMRRDVDHRFRPFPPIGPETIAVAVLSPNARHQGGGPSMLDTTRNPELFAQWLGFIAEDDVKDAFLHLLGLATASTRFTCHIQWKGDVRDFRFHDVGSQEQLHSFITNQRWLLFYFRPQAVRSGRYDRAALAADFESFTENAKGEWHIEIRSVADIHVLSRHIQWHTSVEGRNA